MAKMDLQGLGLYLSFAKSILDLDRIATRFSTFLLKQVGLKGESMKLDSPDGLSSVDWIQGSLIAQKNQPLTWHKVWKCRSVKECTNS